MTTTSHPITQFLAWQRQAEQSGFFGRILQGLGQILLGEAARPAHAAVLATADSSGAPAARMVLIKGVSERGLEVFTNYGSRKARELDENPRATLLLYWPHVIRQIRIEGTVERLGRERNEAYFATRPRGSQIGAWASRQSAEVADREVLMDRVDKYRRRFAGQAVPCPEFWGGYLLIPSHFEFWQGRADRLHDRLCFTRSGGDWRSYRLMP